MEMEIDSDGKEKEEEQKGKRMIVMLFGAPGSGKSTFCDHVIRASSRPWTRICQDIINKGKSGTKAQCLTNAAIALKEGKNIFIDRCNLEREQRAEFMKLGGSQVDMHAVVLDLPAKLCISRCVNRTDHEGKLQGGKAAQVVNRMLQKKELPKLSEGYCRITYCQSENDVQDALNKYSVLGPTDSLPSGYFGQKAPEAKVQVGIMKFLKKLDAPSNLKPDGVSPTDRIKNEEQTGSDGAKQSSSCSPTPKKIREREALETEPVGVALPSEATSSDTLHLPDTITLAFPSISTADFQFDLEKASEIIVDKVQEYLDKCENIKLVLVDLSHKSRILSLVKAKAAEKNIGADRFHTFVGDITRLFSEGGLRCNAIANAANWRLKPGGGGVNAAIYSAAGPTLEVATKERAETLAAGKAVVVPLPTSSPLHSKEGITHVIHVLGPNMNPNRPNYLNGNYDEGCRILKSAYSSLFEGLVSIVRGHSTVALQRNTQLHSEGSEAANINGTDPVEKREASDPVENREGTYEAGRAKKWKGSVDTGDSKAFQDKSENKIGAPKVWSSWTQALYNVAIHPEKHKSDTLEVASNVIVLKDMYPKAKHHVLVLARLEGLDRVADVREEHLPVLRMMHDVGMNWAKKFIQDDMSLIFRIGYHSVPSMRQLHLHVISQDFDSPHLKNKKHWNSFNTAFFVDSVDVIEEVSKHGKASVGGNDSVLSMELRCHRCKSAHPNIPRLKAHIKNCQASFPAQLLEGGRLIQAKT